MEKMVQMIIEAFIKVEGQAKWDSLTAQQQHDVIMTIAKDTMKALNNLN